MTKPIKPSDVAQMLDAAHRIGNDTDEPEGTRYIQISDTMAKELSKALREMEK